MKIHTPLSDSWRILTSSFLLCDPATIPPVASIFNKEMRNSNRSNQFRMESSLNTRLEQRRRSASISKTLLASNQSAISLPLSLSLPLVLHCFSCIYYCSSFVFLSIFLEKLFKQTAVYWCNRLLPVTSRGGCRWTPFLS